MRVNTQKAHTNTHLLSFMVVKLRFSRYSLPQQPRMIIKQLGRFSSSHYHRKEKQRDRGSGAREMFFFLASSGSLPPKIIQKKCSPATTPMSKREPYRRGPESHQETAERMYTFYHILPVMSIYSRKDVLLCQKPNIQRTQPVTTTRM